jgi:small-conductance mechanosensitive channel
VVAILFIIAIIGLVRPFLQDIRIHGGIRKMMTSFQAPTFHVSQLFTMFVIAVLGAACAMALSWDFSAKIVPLVVGTVALLAAGFSLFNDMCRIPEPVTGSLAEQTMHEVEEQLAASGGTPALAPAGADVSKIADQKIHMDLTSETDHVPVELIIKRAARFFGYLVGFMGVMSVIGLIPTVGLFVVFFMRYENQERWTLVITYASILILTITLIFEHVMHIPWPPTFIGQWFPVLKWVPSV